MTSPYPTTDVQVELETLTAAEAAVPEVALASAPDLVLRDESDAIMDSLKYKLRSLEQQLDQLHTHHHFDLAQQQQWLTQQEALAPHLAQRLHEPAKALVEQLATLLSEPIPPPLREALADCHHQAHWLSDALQQMASTHLHFSAVGRDSAWMSAEDFANAFQQTCLSVGFQCTHPAVSVLPKAVNFSVSLIKATLGVWQELARSQSEALPIMFSTEIGAEGQSELCLLCEGIFATAPDWHHAPAPIAASSHPAAESRSVFTAEMAVSWFYLEKIVSTKGGMLRTVHSEGNRFGIKITLPQ